MPKIAKEFTKITALIKAILNGYPGNEAILREYLQNTDDSGATKQTFILDQRSYPTQSLVDLVLKGAQGPALIAINNSLFAKRDWEALLKINSSSKQEDDAKTGKNGLGFRASYHLTENPHVLSGRTLMILDPHNEFTEHPGGLSIDLIEEAEQYQDQILPFISCIDGMTFPYDGTAFRLPLRTTAQALKSDIKPMATSVQDLLKIFLEFANQELEEAILFLKHITSIEIFLIDPSGNKVCLSKVTVDPRRPATLTAYTRRTTVTSADGTVTSRDWKFHCYSPTKDEAKVVMDRRLGYDIGHHLTQDKLSPAVDLAFPLDGSFVRGRIFTLLPIPQYTDFPIHLNAVFALDPSRQNLKSIREVGVASSRERLLIEWNKNIFDNWTPKIWADLLMDLSSLSPAAFVSANWKLWPPREIGEDCYWSGLTVAFTNVVVARRLAVFPTVSGATVPSRLVRITDKGVLLASSDPQISLSLLSELGISVIQPPSHIYAALLISQHAVILTPETLHRTLLCNLSQYEGLADSNLKSVMDYLVFSSGSPKLQNITGLPWFRRAKDNRRISLDLAGSNGTKTFIPQTCTEAEIFVDSTDMLAWNTFSDKLWTQLSQPSTSTILNVGVLEPQDVSSFLKHRLAHLRSFRKEILNVQSDCDYIIDFWTWIIEWSKGDVFFRDCLEEVSALFLLPTSGGSLRKISSGIIHFGVHDIPFVDAWNTFQIYSIAPKIPDRAISKLRAAAVIPFPRSWDQIFFLIDNANLASSYARSQSVFEDIRRYLLENLPQSPGSLSERQTERFKRFQIFMVKSIPNCVSSLSTINGHCICIQVEEELPLPLLRGYPNAIYIDANDSATLSFVRLIDNEMKIYNEVSLLELAIENWEIQSADIQDQFIDRIFRFRPSQLPPSLLKSLSKLAFVVVNNSQERKIPSDLIDPSSNLKGLYLGEIGRFPAGRFAEANLLSAMQEFGFLRFSLDVYIVEDRISYLIEPSNAADGRLMDKAVEFVALLNFEWKSDYTHIVEKYRSRKWIPFHDGPPILISPSESRDDYCDDHNHPYYFDQVLTCLKGQAFRQEFRAALGWSEKIPSDILVAQLSATLKNSNQIHRLTKLLTYLNRLLSSNDLHRSALQKLRSVVKYQAWVPSNSYSDPLLETRYALLETSGLKAPFFLVHMDLMNSLPILRTLGCSNRPSLSVLVAELDRLYKLWSRTTSIPFKLDPVLVILQEIVNYHQDRLDGSGINVPGDDGHSHPLSAVYFCDVKVSPLNIPRSLQGKFPAHHDIHLSLSQSLGIPSLGSLMLEDELEDEDEEQQMDIDLVASVKQFLSDFDPQYALNEFLANANDAHATTFSILLDKRCEAPQGFLIAPKFKELLSGEMLFLHNDSKLTKNDLKGIRKVGRGGKQGDVTTHGRHGLGALSLYYFTDVATIISGDSVLILDPSSNYLPPFRNGIRRTATVKKISEFVSRFPGQVERCESQFGFSSKDPKYDGTIFCLPLKATMTEKNCNLLKTIVHLRGSWRQLASRGLFFTDLESITAKILATSNQSMIWSFFAKRSPVHSLVPSFEYHEIIIREESEDQTVECCTETAWIVATSETGMIPENFGKISQVLKLTQHTKVQLALNPQDVENSVFKGYSFSTVSLPRETSLPFHVNARFAISSNRQDLVLNPDDSAGNKDSHTSLNTWILETLVPPLYLEVLCLLSSPRTHRLYLQDKLQSKNWFFSPCSDDVASRIVQNAFLKALPQSHHAIFRDVRGCLISFSEAVFSLGEPREVMEYLTKVQAPTYVESEQYSTIANLDGSNVVCPTFVRKVLLTEADPSLSSLCLTPEYCFAIFNYLAEESSLIGLPLLVLQSRDIIAVPDASDTPVYFCDQAEHAHLFSSSQFMGTGSYTPTVTAQLVSNPSINVTFFNKRHVINLVEKELKLVEHPINWVHDFWRRYETLPGPPDIASLEYAGLSIIEATLGGNPFLLPLNKCRPDTVVYNTGFNERIINILHTLGIETITDENNRLLKAFLKYRFKDNIFSNVLLCIVAKGIDTLSSLDPGSQDELSIWIQTHITSTLSLWRRDPSSMPLNKSDLMRLKIWDVYSDGVLCRSDSTNLKILPSHLEIHDIAPYLQKNVTLAPWSSLLQKFLSLCSGRTKSQIAFTPSQILSIVILPPTVTLPAEITSMKAFLSSMFHYSDDALQSCKWSVPDSNGKMRPVQDLYDNSITLFRSTLRLTPSFLHDDFKEFLPHLRKLGLIHEITIKNFVHCANAVSIAYRDHRANVKMRDVVRQMSMDAFDIYQSQIPALVLMQSRQRSATGFFQRLQLFRSDTWSSLDDIPFVLRKNVRRQAATYFIQENYVAETLLSILPPSSFVLPAYEPIAWTQRALFFVEPIDGLVTVNRSLGIPTTNEVVNHLVLLTTVIALDHPGDKSLLSDIKATYAWLNKNATSARWYLHQFKSKKLFLNVNNPMDSWDGNWASAEQLVFNLEYDHGPLKIMRGFLKQYEALLCAAGCAEIKTSRQQEPNVSHAPGWMVKFDKMRKENKFTDIELVVAWKHSESSTWTNDTNDVACTPGSPTVGSEVDAMSSMYSYAGGTKKIERVDLRAHRVIMAYVIPHIYDLEWKQKSEHDGVHKITFHGSAFAAKAVVDFVYTGEIELSITTTDRTALIHLMHDLLEVLRMADEWGMEDLKTRIQWEIVSKHDIVRCLLEEYDTLLSYAIKYKADQILAALKEIEHIRQKIVQIR